MSLEEAAKMAHALLRVRSDTESRAVCEALRAALEEASVVNQQLTTEAEPVAWTDESATALAYKAGFAGTSWSMGPEELAHVLNTAQVPPRRELSEEEIDKITFDVDVTKSITAQDWLRLFARAVLRKACGTE